MKSDPDRKAFLRLHAARYVAEHWRDTSRLEPTPLNCVLAAMDGELDPDKLGVEPSSWEGRALRLMRDIFGGTA